MYKRADDFAKTLKKSVIVELDDKVAAEEQVMATMWWTKSTRPAP